eukprot:5073128-Prorocentrum_lima.AAC.1
MSLCVPIWLGAYAEGSLRNRNSGMYHELPWPSWMQALAGQHGFTTPAHAEVARQQSSLSL